MKFNTSPLSLKLAYQAVRSVMSSKNAMPVLDNILFSPSDDGTYFTLTASDNDLSVSYPLEIEEGQNLVPFLVPAAKLGEYIKSVHTDLPLVFEVDRGQISITDIFAEGYEADFKIACYEQANEYPLQREIEGEVKSFSVGSPRFVSSLSSARRYCSNNYLRPIMCGVYVNVTSDLITICASDGSRLFRDRIHLDLSSDSVQGEEFGIVFPSKMVSLISSIMRQDGAVSCFTDGKHICIQQGHTTIRGRLIDGKYPRVESVIPKNNTRTAILNNKQLIAAVERVMIASNALMHLVKFEFDGASSVALSGQDVDNSTHASLRIPVFDPHDCNITIGVRGKNLLEVLQSFSGADQICLAMSEPNRSILVTAKGDDDLLCLVMPVQLVDF